MNKNEFPSNVTLCKHPVLANHLAILRNKNSNAESVRNAARRVGHFILLEATRDLALQETVIETPIAQMTAQVLAEDTPIIATPILRAGLMMADVMMDVIPTASIYYIGLYRDEKTLQPVTYYNKLPANLAYKKARFFVLDPMLATGGTVHAAIKIITQLGGLESNITFVSLISSPEGIRALLNVYPKIQIYTGSIDEKLNEHGYIIPGLGDAGDRFFGTL